MLDNIIVIFEVLIRQFIWLVMPARRTQEILMLRKELQVLHRSVKRPQLNSWDRLFFVSLFRLGNCVVDNIVTIKPNTVLAWHRKLAVRKWTSRQKLKGRPATVDEVRQLIIEMKTNNRRWGARRIVGDAYGLKTSYGPLSWTSKTILSKILHAKNMAKLILIDQRFGVSAWLTG